MLVLVLNKKCYLLKKKINAAFIFQSFYGKKRKLRLT
ncbi:MAG: hypothetical protein JWR61_3508 [Ferruginibacter sp.]|nr:hypothetical protein [Ferruginibacter sp.]